MSCTHDYKASPEGLPAPLKEEQDLRLMSGGWPGPRVTVTQWGRAPGVSSVVIQVAHCTRAVGKGRMHSCQVVGLKDCVHQKRAPFTNSHTGPAVDAGRGASLEHAHWQRRGAWA